MKKYQLYCRYNDIHVIVEDEGKYKVSFSDCAYLRAGYQKDSDELSFVDPPGGPFVSVGHSLSDFNNKLPDLEIKGIEKLHFNEGDEYCEYNLIVE